MEIFRLFGSVFIDTDKADQSLQKTEKNTQNAATKMYDAFKKIGTAVATVFTVDKIKDFGQACKDAAVAISAETAAFAQIMGDYSEKAQEKINEVANVTGIVEGRLTGYMTSMTAKFQGLGYDINDATDLAKNGLMIAADAAAFWDKSMEDSMSALNSFVNGSYEGGESIGLFANETTLASWAAENLGMKWDDLAEKEKQFARLEFAKAMQETSGVTGQAANESGAYANVMGNLTRVWDEFKGKIGEPILERFIPIIQNLIEKVQNATLWINEHLSPAFERMDEIAGGVSEFWNEVLQPAVSAVGDALVLVGEAFLPIIQGFTDMLPKSEESISVFDLFKEACGALEEALLWVAEKLTVFSDWVEENQPLIENLIIVIGSFTAAWYLVDGAVKLWNATCVIAQGVTTALGAVIGFLTSPIGLAVIAVGALIAIGVALYKNWDVVKEKALELWTKVTDTFEKMKMAVSIIISAMSMYFSEKIESMKAKAIAVFDGIKNTIEEKIQAAKDFVGKCIEKIKGFFDFEWSLPDLKLPHFSIDGEFSLNPPSVPSIGIDWYAKAMNAPMILNEPTIFDINAEGEPMGAGEAGSEIVGGTNTLMNMIAAAVASQNEALIAVLYMILDAILRMDQNMGGNLRKALEGMSLKIDKREAARFVREVI